MQSDLAPNSRHQAYRAARKIEKEREDVEVRDSPFSNRLFTLRQFSVVSRVVSPRTGDEVCAPDGSVVFALIRALDGGCMTKSRALSGR